MAKLVHKMTLTKKFKKQKNLKAENTKAYFCSSNTWGDFKEYIPLSVLPTFLFSKIHKLAKLEKKYYQILLADYEKTFCQEQKKRFSHFLNGFHLPYVPT